MFDQLGNTESQEEIERKQLMIEILNADINCKMPVGVLDKDKQAQQVSKLTEQQILDAQQANPGNVKGALDDLFALVSHHNFSESKKSDESFKDMMDAGQPQERRETQKLA